MRNGLAERGAAAEASRMPRLWIWIQLVIGWFPVWALYATLIVAAHPPTTVRSAALLAMHAIVPAALLGLVVHRFTRRLPWPRPFRLSFVLLHALAAATYAIAWLVLASLSQIVLLHSAAAAISRVVIPFLVLGVWLYVMVAGVSYAAQATDRAVVAEASAARAQLATLRAQLHPHFLFNALHTVVQLIPIEPRRAAEAAELVAGLLRTALEEERDLVSLGEELSFVGRYLDIERIRFGDRLRVEIEVGPDARARTVPSFALQTLVENAVQHGAAPRIEPTTVRVHADVRNGALLIRVQDDGAGMTTDAAPQRGTGLTRLRERLLALYGLRASLDVGTASPCGYIATLEIADTERAAWQ